MKLKELRKENHLTQNDVAKILNVNQRTYSGYELGLSEPNIQSLIKLAELYHVSLDELLGRDCNIINLNALEEETSTLIKKIINMNKIQKLQTINFVNSLTMFD